jgi:predicted esterase YcpF (UPF0227 family)
MSDHLNPSTRLIYLHGFLSSPESQKAVSLIDYAQTELGVLMDQGKFELLVPELPHKPEEAVALIENLVSGSARTVFIGSSLGGFYSIYFAEKLACKAILVNPLVILDESLADNFLGHHTNYYTGEEVEIDIADAEFLMTLEMSDIRQQDNYLLLLETGDEVLDYKQALAKFPNANQHVIKGGNHRFESFEKFLPEMMTFAEVSV